MNIRNKTFVFLLILTIAFLHPFYLLKAEDTGVEINLSDSTSNDENVSEEDQGVTNEEPEESIDGDSSDEEEGLELLEDDTSVDVIGTEKSGMMEENEVWTKESSPYLVSDFYIPSGVVLNIESGVEIFVSSSIAVFGKVVATGTGSDSILFKQNEDAFSSDLYIGDSGEVEFNYVDFEGINSVTSNGKLKTNHFGFVDSSDGFTLVEGSLTIFDNSLIEGVSSGSYLIGSYQNSDLAISNSQIFPASATGLIILGGKTEIKNTKISGGLENGIEMYPYQGGASVTNPEVLIENSEISGFEKNGIFAIDPKLTITGSKIIQNHVGIESYARSNYSLKALMGVFDQNNTAIIFGLVEDNPTIIFDVRENFWGDKSGPFVSGRNDTGQGDEIVTYRAGTIDRVLFAPWLLSPPGQKRNPVIIIPGIMGSYLNHDDEEKTEVWINLVKGLFPGGDSYLDDLILQGDGKLSKDNDIFSNGVIKIIRDDDFFDGLIQKLKSEGYEEDKDLFIFPYDWRLDTADNVNGVSESKVESLKDKIDSILESTWSSKVDMVAHSMGGLLAKYYIKYVDRNKIDKFIDIGTPHLGAPKAAKVLNYGDDMGIKFGPLGLNFSEIKKISQNMPSVYNLLPSQKYFDTTKSDYSYYLFDLGDVDSDGTIGKLSYESTEAFLKNTGRNNLLLQTAESFHNDMDSFNPKEYGVQSYNIVGCGTPTVGKIFANNKKTLEDFQYQLLYISGDGTVPQRSAEGMDTDNLYYAKGVTHATMPSQSGIKNLVSSILLDSKDSFDFTSNQNIATSTKDCDLPNGKYLSIHSPVALHVYDEEGRHTGPDENGDIEYNIPDLTYDILEDNKFAFIPDNANYTIKLTATGIGTMGVHIKDYKDGEIVRTEYFDNVPIESLDTKGEVVFELEASKIIIDKGDGLPEDIILASVDTEGDTLLDLEAPQTIIQSIEGKIVGDMYKENPIINFRVTDVGLGVLKTEYSINNEDDWAEIVDNRLKVEESGVLKLYYRSVDKAGNIESSKSVDLNIETSNRHSSSGSSSTKLSSEKIATSSDGVVLGTSIINNIIAPQNNVSKNNTGESGVVVPSSKDEEVVELKTENPDTNQIASVSSTGFFSNILNSIFEVVGYWLNKIIGIFK